MHRKLKKPELMRVDFVGSAKKIDFFALNHPVLLQITLLVWFLLLRLPMLFEVSSYEGLVVPLDSLYVSNWLWSEKENKDFSSMVISPSNAGFIYPAGFYLIAKLAGSVKNMLLVLFVSQLATPWLYYAILRKISPPFIAILLTLLETYYFTRSNWWSPDFLIQPLMLAAFLVLLSVPLRRGKIPSLIILGQLVGGILVIKHNVGVFFAILCGTWMFFNAMSVSKSDKCSGNVFAYMLLLGFLIFIPLFGRRLLYLDEQIYYLLPYSLFWILVGICIIKQRFLFNALYFIRGSVVFGVSSIILPLVLFRHFGSMVGYERYWYSLFGMGFKYLHIWDHGIIQMVQLQFIFTSLPELYRSLIKSLLFVLPFVVNLSVVLLLWCRQLFANATFGYEFADFKIASVGIMAGFMLFPLEGYHILASKLFIFIFVGVYFIRRFCPFLFTKSLPFLIALLIPTLAHAAYVIYYQSNSVAAYGSQALHSVIGIPVRKSVADDLGRAIELVRKNVNGSSYYVIDTSGATLISLAAFVDNVDPQYYIEMRPGIVDKYTLDAIRQDLMSRKFLVVNAEDLARGSNQNWDPLLRALMSYILQNYEQVDVYTSTTSSLPDFKIMQRNDLIAYPKFIRVN